MKHNFTTLSKTITMSTLGTFLSFGDRRFGITKLVHAQIAQKLDIPKEYYGDMRKHHPALLSINVNEWLHIKEQTILIETINGDIISFS